MFTLKDNQMYVWHKIFMVLSLDKTFPFLFDIGFPLDSQFREIQEISRSFLKKFFDNEALLYEENRPSKLAENLFTEAYETLRSQIGDESANQFCKWGNRLKLDTEIESKLLKWWSGLKEETKDIGENEAISLTVIILINRYDNYLNAIYSALDYAERASQNSWEKIANEMYNIGDDRRNPRVGFIGNPLDFLEGVVTYHNLSRLLLSIQMSSEVENDFSKLKAHQLFDEISASIK